MTDIAERLDELRESGLHRRLRMVEGPQGPEVLLDGRPVLLLCSNNYLGLAGHPRVRLAAFEGHEAALLFGSGYLANCGVIAAFARQGEVVFSDQLNHASIIDGCRLARAETFVYRHGDLEHLEWGLRSAGNRASLIVTDGLFSMDGDRAPLEGLLQLSRRHRCRLMVDEAHATGTVGPGGRGTVAAADLSGEVDLVIGTLGKALGSYGAYVCAAAETVEYLVNTARSLIFSTALPPPTVAAADEALALLESGPEMVQRLCINAAVLREALAAEGLPVGRSESQIIPVEVGDSAQTMRLSEALLEHGVFAQGIRPPTVPEGSSRLRFTPIASHDPSALQRAARVLGAATRSLGLRNEPAALAA